MMRSRILAALCAPLLLSAAAPRATAQSQPVPITRTWSWDADVVQKAATLPVQDGGRVKPLDTFASFLLLRLNSKRATQAPAPDGSGEMVRLTPTEWLLDVMFFPEQADHYKVFRVADSEVLDAIGLSSIVHKKADRYSFAQLGPGLQKLQELAQQYHRIDEKQQTRIQRQVLTLMRNVNDYYGVRTFAGFSGHDFEVPAALREIESELPASMRGRQSLRFSELLPIAPQLVAMYDRLRHSGADGDQPKPPEGLEGAIAEITQGLEQMLRELSQAGGQAQDLALLPPEVGAPKDAEWTTPAELTFGMLQGRTATIADRNLSALAGLDQMGHGRGDAAQFEAGLDQLRQGVIPTTEARHEYDKVELEVTYYRLDLLFYSQWLYVLGFLLVAFTWMAPRSKWLRRVAFAGVVLPTALLIAGIVLRCILRERPPVTGLYDTVIFITAVAVTIAMIVELIQRRGIALPVGSAMGMAGMFLASRYEISQGTDTMPQLMAVLDTNFWLATHVTCVTTGYAAGLLAGVIAHVYVFGRLFGFRRGNRTFYRGVARTVYGVIAFGLIFSVVGTILGGVWANDSWGRFWGWDPKENGALMICLVELAILHGRMGGFLRDWGVCLMAIFNNVVIAFSWWNVNMLGVGLHSYGFTDGSSTLNTFYLMQGGIIGLGLMTKWFESMHAKAPQLSGQNSTHGDVGATPAPAE